MGLKHTPKPWHVGHCGSGVYVQRGDSGGFIVEGCNAEADAKLIAQAPNMLDAIKDTIANVLCGECGKGCIVFYDEKPCHMNSKPCDEVEKLLTLTEPDWLGKEKARIGGIVDE